ncbi:MAG: DUF4159 domain-containing protein [Bryobacterales bacterium]|nr:DUF4159 domain-containing protein [Bryobacterales bacterium]
MLSPRQTAVWCAVLLAGLLYAQRGFRADIWEDNPAPTPPDADEKTEYLFGRLRYDSYRGRRWGGGSWATDYPKADRQFLQGLRRLTRIHTRSVEQVVDIDSDEIFDYPWLYAVEVGRWQISEGQARRLREYLDRGGFLMVDDFHGTYQWEAFAAGMSHVFPDTPIVDIEDDDPAFHVLYDLDERFQVPGVQYIRSGRTFEQDGFEARWRGIYDDKGRLVVAICFNMDLGDAWEWADLPQYPEPYASLAYRVAINYIIYAMTH